MHLDFDAGLADSRLSFRGGGSNPRRRRQVLAMPAAQRVGTGDVGSSSRPPTTGSSPTCAAKRLAFPVPVELLAEL